MLISKENTGKSKYTLEFHSLRAPPWEPPRQEGKVEDEASARHCEKEVARRGNGHRLCPLSQPLFILFQDKRFTVIELVETILVFDGFDSRTPFFERTRSPKPLTIADDKRRRNNF